MSIPLPIPLLIQLQRFLQTGYRTFPQRLFACFYSSFQVNARDLTPQITRALPTQRATLGLAPSLEPPKAFLEQAFRSFQILRRTEFHEHASNVLVNFHEP